MWDCKLRWDGFLLSIFLNGSVGVLRWEGLKSLGVLFFLGWDLDFWIVSLDYGRETYGLGIWGLTSTPSFWQQQGGEENVLAYRLDLLEINFFICRLVYSQKFTVKNTYLFIF